MEGRMSASTIVLQEPRTALLSRLCDYIELTKPRIAVLELVVILAAGVVATWGQPSPGLLAHAMFGTLLVAASASAANQWLERREDARMPRTANRPLACGRLTSGEALVFAAVCLLAGAADLAYFTNSSAAGWALLTWVLYVLAYTPLKQISSANTAIGAVAGALPVLIGWTAVGGQIDGRAMALFLVLFLWQFPHFMAIAWLYRRDYAEAGYQMLTVIDPTGSRAGRQSVIAALTLIPISILPVLASPGIGSVLYAALAAFLGFCYLLIAACFWRQPSDASARVLLKASLVYLPTVLITLMLAPWI
jgi:protoheme IX farnesyltransferase